MYKPEIVVNKGEPLVGRGVGGRIGVAIEADEPAPRGQPAQNFCAVAASAEGCVGVGSLSVSD